MTEATARYTKLLELHPNNELARFSLGKAYFDSGQFAQAKEQFEIALARKRDWMVVQISSANAIWPLGARDSAKAAFERARQLAIEQEHDGPLAEVEQLLAEC